MNPSLQSLPQEQMSIVIVGHVDHGKSTIIGRLLADTHSLPTGKLEQVQEHCRRHARPFEYAFLLDALKDEQSQGITIDAARVFFKSEKRRYLIMDAPGHIEFLKNMITGAARAQAALLVIDANEGIRENTRRHGYLLQMLGVRRVAVLVNKMDLVGYREDHYLRVVSEFSEFLGRIGVRPDFFIPVSGRGGDGIASRSPNLKWHAGPTVLEALDSFENESPSADAPFRMPVQDVYKFTQQGDSRRIVAGTIETGKVKPGDEVVFYPSGKKSRVHAIEAFNANAPKEAQAGAAVGFTLTEQIYISRGELATLSSQARPLVSTRIRTSLFWLGSEPLSLGKEVILKLGTARIPAKLDHIERIIDASSLGVLEGKTQIERNDVAECVLKLRAPVACDLATDLPATSRFVIVDQYRIAGGGIVREALEDRQSWARERAITRNLKWETSMVSAMSRWERYSQKPALVLISGPQDTDRKEIAKKLEARLFSEGKHVYFLGMGNVLYGVDADLKSQEKAPSESAQNRNEHFRRLGEVAHVLLDAGIILIVSASEITQDDLEIIKTSIAPEQIQTVWLGDKDPKDLAIDLRATSEDVERAVLEIKELLQKKGLIFRPW